MSDCETIGQRLKGANGYTTGFDYLRVALAVCVLLVHSAPISYGPGARLTTFPWYILPFIPFLVPAFFALSGFLVTASLLRANIAVLSVFGACVSRQHYSLRCLFRL